MKTTIFKLSGSIFTLATSLLFYIYLYTASFSNFKVILDYNYYGEGPFELVLFTLVLPFILYSTYADVKTFIKQSKSKISKTILKLPQSIFTFYDKYMK